MKHAGHDVIHVSDHLLGYLRPACRCGWTSDDSDFAMMHPGHVKKARRSDEAKHRAWFKRTQHCGQCGNPGTYCTCRTPCGCHNMHEVGSGLRDDALTQFASADANQGELFG